MSLGATRSARRQANCIHATSVTVRSHRVERRICEDCGHVSFTMNEEALVYGRRDEVAREIDRQVELAVG